MNSTVETEAVNKSQSDNYGVWWTAICRLKAYNDFIRTFPWALIFKKVSSSVFLLI